VFFSFFILPLLQACTGNLLCRRCRCLKATFEVLEKLLSAYCIESFGNSEEEIAEKEAESGIKFPKSLRDYYKKFGKCNYITKSCNNQYEPLLR